MPERLPPPGSRLRVHRVPERPAAAVLLLHGGRADSLQPVPRFSLARLRMRPFASEIGRRPWGRQVLITSVRYRYRGWNGNHAHPAHDALQALEELSARAPGIPVVLIGHSMGGRAALNAAEHDTVRGVIALAPWCPPTERVAHLHGKAAVFLHDEADRVTSAAQTWDFARRAATAGADVQCVPMPGGGHAMLRGARHWQALAADHAAVVLAWPPSSTARTTRRPTTAERPAGRSSTWQG
ncbi:alpha/beta hydrolase [Kitasatospora sp. NBC_01302]|uniref:alpha/beta hydrolase n=1 Tax=Kitasatospora sp. NBC_01302 TaxID=2903575 RepID=UPI002E167C6D|nr:alpha/beta fold hydrolase [Kitasatospora sp. NBC_01302]